MPTPTVFATPLNNISTKLSGPYVAGSGVLTLTPGTGGSFPVLSGSNFYRVTVVQGAVAYSPQVTHLQYSIYKATAIVGDDLTIVGTLDGTADRNYSTGDVVEIRFTQGSLADIHGAVNAIEGYAPAGFVFNQLTPATTWTITHNLARYPAVSVVDSAGTVCYGNVVYTSVNVVTVTFTAGFSGVAYLN